MIEIERKFLVKDLSFKKGATRVTRLSQGFLSTDPSRTVRVRTSEQNAWITVKGMGSEDGTSRFEWEKDIPLEEAKALLKLCKPVIIEKTRYEIPAGNHIFEVDVFHGENEGLLLAEIELNHASEAYELPNWLGKEVTGDNAYYNASLSKHPFSKW